jgi:hypothetical protein
MIMPETFLVHKIKQQATYCITRYNTEKSKSLKEISKMDIITVNTNGVNLMRQGNFQKAIFFFREALREFHLITGVQRKNMNTAPTDQLEVTRTFRREVSSIPLGDALSVLTPSIYQDHDAFSIFDRAFLIDSSDLASLHSIEGQNYTTTVILFNMGLAYQLLNSNVEILAEEFRAFQMNVLLLHKKRAVVATAA